MSYQYLLDANVFIQATNVSYPMDIFPIFWKWLEDENNAGVITSTISIYDEIKGGDDDLSEWAKGLNKGNWFLPVDDENTQSNYSCIANWVVEKHYSQPAIQEFLSVADSWLIAKAMTMGNTIVTQEKSSPNSIKRILIPDVCNELGVNHINTFKLLKTRKPKF